MIPKKNNDEDILLLAFNRSAANELKDRFNIRAKELTGFESSLPKIKTFHALGKQILGETKQTTYVSDFATDKIKLKMWISKWLVDYISSGPEQLKKFIQLSYQPINPFDFDTKEEYDAYVRDNEYRTLQGERVKGYQELLIANWLFLNGVSYEYEAPYVTKRRIEIGYDYRPDFHINETSIYLEHFGIDRLGNVRSDINKVEYNEQIKRKRALHKECETTLIETYHYDWVEDKLEARLETILNEVGVRQKKLPDDEILSVLNKLGFIDVNASRYLKCLEAIRIESLDSDGILDRLQLNNIVYADDYRDFFKSLVDDYQAELRNQDRIDFEDMIILSTKVIEEGVFTPKWKHILVDEFQDISMSRMKFVQTLIDHGPSPILTVVGDDWQSIYRFSGGKLELTTRFEELVGSHTITKLDKTFRYNNSIADIAGTFIMENPEQYVKKITTHERVKKRQVYLLDSTLDHEDKLQERSAEVIKRIRKEDHSGQIAVMSRYNYLINDAKKYLIGEGLESNVKFWTFHRSKGLEADYCILIGFFQGRSGFPNNNKEEAVIEALLPMLDTFAHSEERRLFYVALTRARKKSYLIADPMATSEFVNEILSPKYPIHIISETFEKRYREIFKCPLCSEGYFKRYNGRYGSFYSCSSGSICKSKPRECGDCKSPSIDNVELSICNNPNCKKELDICDKCGRPMKVRSGRFGKFWGCTGYGIKKDQCKNTRRYFG